MTEEAINELIKALTEQLRLLFRCTPVSFSRGNPEATLWIRSNLDYIIKNTDPVRALAQEIDQALSGNMQGYLADELRERLLAHGYDVPVETVKTILRPDPEQQTPQEIVTDPYSYSYLGEEYDGIA